ncbi:MAG: PKD domain-containing protein [Thermoplasmata archaeon]
MRLKAGAFALLLIISTSSAPLAAVELVELSQGSGARAGDNFGAALAAADVNGDGAEDICVGAPGSDLSGNDAGAVYIFYGPVSASPSALSAGLADVVLTGTISGALFGSSISGGGDINGDSVDDIVIGAPGHMGERGAAFVFFGGSLSNCSAEFANVTILGSQPGEGVGKSVSIPGDLNGDGLDDFALGVPGASWSGEARVYFGGRLSGRTLYPDLWELPQDWPQPLDFTSGLNSTGNTFTLSGDDDGWDWERNIYGGADPNVLFLLPDGANEAALHLRLGGVSSGGGAGNNNVPVSGGFGIEFFITAEMCSQIRNGSTALLAFDWEILDEAGLEAWDGEVAWLKACISNATGRYHLGSSLDADSQPQDDDRPDSVSDSTPEIYFYDWGDGMDRRVSGHFFSEVTKYFSAPGYYYLDFGAKLGDWSHPAEYLHVLFDNITLFITPLHTPDAVLYSPCSPGFGNLVSGGGDFNGDGLCDLIVVGDDDRVFVYYGNPMLGEVYGLKWASITPTAKAAGDTTGEPIESLQSDDNQYYRVGQGRVMWLNGFRTSGLEGVLNAAFLFCSFRTRTGTWYEYYSGANPIRLALPTRPLTNTSLQPWYTPTESLLGPLDLTGAGVVEISDLSSLQVEFTNNDGGSRDDWVEFDVVYVVLAFSASPSVTISGPALSNIGASAAPLGDLDSDGYGEIALGAPNASEGCGAVYVFGGGPGLKSFLNHTRARAIISGTASNSRFGEALASGMVSLDGVRDLLIGAPGARCVYLFNGTPELNDARADQADARLEAGGPEGLFGSSLFAADIDSHGCAEVLVGAPGEGGKGKAYLFSNPDERTVGEALEVTFLPARDPIILEGETQEFSFRVLNPVSELGIRSQWYLDSALIDEVRGNRYNYTSTHTSAGIHEVMVRIWDGFRSTSHNWRVNVLDVNAPPIVNWWPAGDFDMAEGETVTLVANAFDVDNDSLEFRWRLDGEDIPHGLPLYHYTPDFSSAGEHQASCTVSDGHGHLSSYIWNISVRNLNRPPVIVLALPAGESVSVYEGEELAFSIQCLDPDGDALSLMWYYCGALVAVNTYDFTLRPDYRSAGTKEVRAAVSDGEATTTRCWSVSVIDVNAPPVVVDSLPRGEPKVNAGEAVDFWISAIDPDGNSLTVSWLVDGEAAGWGSFSHRVLTSNESPSTQLICAIVSDGQNIVFRNWTLRVNHPPRISSWIPVGDMVALKRGEARLFFITSVDPDGDLLEVSWQLDGAPVTGAKGNSIRLAGDGLEPAFHTLSVFVSDGALEDFHEWVVEVGTGPLQPPIPVIELRPRVPRVGQELVLFAGESRDDGEIVNYTWELGDGTVGHGPVLAHVYTEAGTYTVRLTITDNEGNRAEATVVVAVLPAIQHGRGDNEWRPVALLVLMVLIPLLVILTVIVLLQRKILKGLASGDEPDQKKADLDGGDG